MRRTARLLISFAVALTAPAQAFAQADWRPERPIRLIVPFSPGSSSDIVARIVAQKLGERLKQQVFVENRVGASGNLGSEAVARAQPDGYTMGLANASTHAVAPSYSTNLGYDPLRDFAPVAMLGASPFVLNVFPGLPARSVGELIALAKAKPRTLTYASAGPATLAHLAGALFASMAHIEMVHVPYRGTGQAAIDLMDGRVDMQFGTIPPSVGNIRDGKLRALGVTGATRNNALPDVPTIAESGLPGYEASLWQGYVVPAGTPQTIVAKLNREVTAALADPAVRAALIEQGVEPEPGPPEAMEQRMRADAAKWHDVIVAAGIHE
ncbi:MAG TPA: tripartite tricarboxylate transporter substrate binding protein [Xanthobacteraceae bacterium]|jgi:tripartite-type tricarboxylate transporter receptor subunit TctC|nr:tripartite tricarboxylate transporter substrate binding protein [Xanthobacteraceae bacterium]